MKALICGRGKSLQYYKNLLDKDFDYIYLINEFNGFIREDKNLLAFLKNASKKSKIIQQVNIEVYGVDKFLVDNLSIDECHIARLSYKPNYRSPWRPYVDTKKFIKQGIDLEVLPQPDEIEPYLDMDIVKGSLFVAMLNAAISKKCNNITIIGLDFYEKDYFLSHKGPDWHLVSVEKVQNTLKKSLTDICNLFPDIRYDIHTYSSYQNELGNCFINNL